MAGVKRVEGFRSVPIRMRNGLAEKRLALLGLEPETELFRVLDANDQAILFPEHSGLTITEKLATKLGIQLGDEVEIDVLEGEERSIRMVVQKIFANYTGPAAFLPRSMLHSLMREGEQISGAFVSILAGTAALAFTILRPKSILVDTARVDRGPVEVTVEDDGQTRVRERYTIIAPMNGKLVRLSVHAGDPVLTEGSPIAILQPSDSALLDPRTKLECEARVQAAQDAILRAQETKNAASESLELTEHEYSRSLELIRSGSISQSEFDLTEHRFRIARAELRSADFQRSIAEHELNVARAALIASQSPGGEPMNLFSPINGVVLRVLREDAGYLTAGTSILEVGNPQEMEIQIDVLSTAAVSIQPGNRVTIDRWGKQTPLHGRVRRVEPSAFLKISALGVEERRVYVLIDIDEAWVDRKELGDGFRVEAKIIVDRKSTRLNSSHEWISRMPSSA